MNVSKKALNAAAEKGVLTPSQVEPLWNFLENRTEESGVLPIFYYLGGLLAIGGITAFMTIAWDSLGGIAIALLSTLFAAVFWIFGYHMGHKKNAPNVGGFFATISVFTVPFIVYSLEKGLGLWIEASPDSFPLFYTSGNACWIAMDISLIVAGIATIRYILFPFLVFPIAMGAWFLSVDMTLMFVAANAQFFEVRQWISLFFGLLMLGFGYWLKNRIKPDYSFWIYFFGLVSLDIALSLLWGKGEGFAALYALCSIAIMSLTLLYKRKIFLVFGALNLLGYLVHLTDIVFANSLLFTLALICLGIATIAAGIFCSRLKISK